MRDNNLDLVQIVKGLYNSSILPDVCNSLENSEFTLNSTDVLLNHIASGRPGVSKMLRDLRNIWEDNFSSFDGSQMSKLICVIEEAMVYEFNQLPKTQVVWTGPNVDGSYLRATRQVVRDIVSGANKELLVVGYWISAGRDNEGIIREIIESVAESVSIGVEVKIVLDNSKKPYGKDNLQILLELWPSGVALPKLLTWHTPQTNNYYKLHAKVIVADKNDALITSANLTMLAFDCNMEMGVRLLGSPAREIASHFDLLIEQGEIGPYKT